MKVLKSMEKEVLRKKVDYVLRSIHSKTSKKKIKFTLEASELILGTIAQESAFGKYRRQLGNGPARGIVQMEGATALDIFNNYLNYREELKGIILSFTKDPDTFDCSDIEALEDELEVNDSFSIAMCRIHYLRAPMKLPLYQDIKGLAKYWKKFYNTELGAGTVEEFEHNYERYLK